MKPLNLPQFDYKIEKKAGKNAIFDMIRKKYVVLTPEEWVRQHFVHYLIEHLQYPKTLISIEGGLQYNRMQKRSDIVVYTRNTLPFMLIECKAPEVKVSQRIFEQAAMYNQTLKAVYVVITNGLEHYCCQIDHENASYQFMNELPVYG
jgi:hypothetical protein